MKRLVGAAAVAAGAGLVVARRMTGKERGAADLPLAVTVNRSPEDVAPGGRLPEPLRRVGDLAEFDVRPAPGDRGTEIEARMTAPVPTGVRGAAARVTGDDPRQPVREALREAKSLLETGEVLRADTPPSTHPTPAGKVLDLVTRRSGGEGRL
ncbi:SRPBCC family protein [Actinoallomurus rhizosphaericola]|uniref:hypothetical protein n=1 Tax=Actinoallomurus rhizosphaericola TaxID=2952536 RepID=UPI002092A9EA|nr:hypothetical protein [Actinoallomurus rhizosphaericola]MCO5997830.1 hypothetical protein [Actinoallomurus rhizosphaericola]